jgi:hypothetical protein
MGASINSATGPLGLAVDRFCGNVTTALVEVTHSVGNTSDASNVANIASDGDLAGDVSVEAYRIACAFIDSDGRHSDDELWPLIGVFGGRFDTQLAGATPAKVRETDLLRGARRWLDRPSDLFEILLGADRLDGGERALGYYRDAMAIAPHSGGSGHHLHRGRVGCARCLPQPPAGTNRDGRSGQPCHPGEPHRHRRSRRRRVLHQRFRHPPRPTHKPPRRPRPMSTSPSRCRRLAPSRS